MFGIQVAHSDRSFEDWASIDFYLLQSRTETRHKSKGLVDINLRLFKCMSEVK
jgi:hypothetical protein